MADTSIDYDNVTIPDPNEKPMHSWSYPERRARILRLIEQAGHPRAINRSDLARRFDVSTRTICNDFEALAEWIEENLTREHEFVMDRVLNGAMHNLMRDGDYFEAAKVAKMWYEWLADRGSAHRVPRGVNVDATVREANDSTDYYTVIPDDEADALQAASVPSLDSGEASGDTDGAEVDRVDEADGQDGDDA